MLNNCSAFAECKDLPNGYSCECLAGYKDAENVTKNGTNCIKSLLSVLTCNCIKIYNDFLKSLIRVRIQNSTTVTSMLSALLQDMKSLPVNALHPIAMTKTIPKFFLEQSVIVN